MHRKARSQALLDCIQSCKHCHDICVETAAYCLEMGGQHAVAKHMRLLLDCAQICTMSEDYMLRDSEFYAQLCGVCADVCDSCAAACDKFVGDEQMEDCVSACEICADACRAVAGSRQD
jgi:hypothetical protein